MECLSLSHFLKANKKQTIRFAGVGAPHQNSVAERAIGVVTFIALNMMLHAAMHSPEGAITANLWPMAMDYAVWLCNHLPQQDSGFSPSQLWSRLHF